MSASNNQLAECKQLVEMLQKSLNACDVNELPDVQIAMLQNLINNATTANSAKTALDNMQNIVDSLASLRKEKKVTLDYGTRIEILVVAQNIAALRNQTAEPSGEKTAESSET